MGVRPGQIVRVDFRNPLRGSGEVNKLGRPAIVIGAPPAFGSGLPFELVVPLTGEPVVAVPGVFLTIDPTPDNGCAKTSYAISWNVQCVPHARMRATQSFVTEAQLRSIRTQVVDCVGVVAKEVTE